MNLDQALRALTDTINLMVVELRTANLWNKAIFDELRALRTDLCESEPDDTDKAPPTE